MTKPLIQIGDEVREMTDAEYNQWEADAETQITFALQLAAKADARVSALAKLSKLGLTNEELAALVE